MAPDPTPDPPRPAHRLELVTTAERYDEATLNWLAATVTIAWTTFTETEQALVRFGLFPRDRMQALEVQFPEIGRGDRGRLIAVALMNCAKADGGMRA
jgi:hypothetical protein